MITKGIIRKVQDNNTYSVWVPFFDDPSEDAAETILTATLAEAAGINGGYSIGDVVYCAFEDNTSSRAVIIGKLSGADVENTGGTIDGEYLTITKKAVLPTDTIIDGTKIKDVLNNLINFNNSPTSGTGTVTSVGVQNAQNGGLTISGSPITSSGVITIGHSNNVASQSIQEVYNIKYDTHGHITAGQLYNPDWNLSVTNRTVANPTDSDIIKTVPFVKQGTDSGKTGVILNADSNTASGANSIAEGTGTIAGSANQHVQGKYNVSDTSGTYVDIVGWGTNSSSRKNISALTTSGTQKLKEDIYIKSNDDSTGGYRLVPTFWQCTAGSQSVTTGTWIKLCHLNIKSHMQGRFIAMRIFMGDGNNSRTNQNAYIDLTMQASWTGSDDGRLGCTWLLEPLLSPFTLSNVDVQVIATNTNLDYDVWFWTSRSYCIPSYEIFYDANIVTLTHNGTEKINANKDTKPTGGTLCNIAGKLSGGVVYPVEDHLNVLNYGVKNDGTNAANNTVILNQLIQDYGFNKTTNGKTLYFPDGTYALGPRTGVANDAPILVVPHSKPINFWLSPNAKLTATQGVNGIIEIGESDDGVVGIDGFPPVIIHGGIVDCSTANFGIVHWSGRPLIRIEDVAFQNIGDGKTGLWLGKSSGGNVKASGDAKVINCTFNGQTSGVNSTAIRIDSNDNEVTHVRINGCKYGITQAGGSTYYDDIHMTVTSSGGGTVDSNSTVGLDVKSNNAYLNDVYFDTFGIGLKIESNNSVVYCNNCIWYAYYSKNTVTYKNIAITADGFPQLGYLSLVNCSMTHPTSNISNFNYIYFGDFSTTNRVYQLVNSNSIKIVDCNFDFTGVPMYDMARNICFSNKPITVRPEFVNMTANSYYPIAYVMSTNYDTYKLKFNLTTVASGEIDFVYYNGNLTTRYKRISTSDTTFSLALINPTNHTIGGDTTTWAYLCLVTNASGKKLGGTFEVSPGGAFNRVTATEYGGGSGVYNPSTMYSPISSGTVVGVIPITNS